MLLFVQRWEQVDDSKARVSARERRFAGEGHIRED